MERVIIDEVPYGSLIEVYVNRFDYVCFRSYDAAKQPNGQGKTLRAYLVGFRTSGTGDDDAQYMIGFDATTHIIPHNVQRVRNHKEETPKKWGWGYSESAWNRITHRLFTNDESMEVILVTAAKDGVLPGTYAPTYPANVHSSLLNEYDPTTDWRTWQRHGLQPDECVCRIPRKMCRYHG